MQHQKFKQPSISALFFIKRSKSGLGLFARVPINKSSFIVEYTGERIANQEADRRGGLYLFNINSRWTIDGKDRGNIARYINHCCNPNCETRIIRGSIRIYAVKDIAVGEELTYDYGKDYFEAYIRPKGCVCAYCANQSQKPPLS